MKKAKPSAAFTLLSHVWANVKGGSWERLNHAMHYAVELAIGSGMEFAEGDWKKIASEFSSGYWAGADGFEPYYALAIAVGNVSAYTSLESHFGRQPFIADEVTPGSRYNRTPWMHGGGGTRQRERLALGFSFPWKGETVEVTSIRSDYLVACSHTPRESDTCPTCNGCCNYRGGKLLRRYRITREDIIADRAERKERREIEAQLHSLDLRRLWPSHRRVL